jgi:hypothetical protein
MSQLIHFFQSEHFIALSVTVLIFLITIFLAVKQWIGFTVTLLLLLLALAAGLIINNQHGFPASIDQASLASALSEDKEAQDAFQKKMWQAMEDLKVEVQSEKENLRSVGSQLQEILDSVEAQKQKLQSFIEETREQFKKEYAPALPLKENLTEQ